MVSVYKPENPAQALSDESAGGRGTEGYWHSAVLRGCADSIKKRNDAVVMMHHSFFCGLHAEFVSKSSSIPHCSLIIPNFEKFSSPPQRMHPRWRSVSGSSTA